MGFYAQHIFPRLMDWGMKRKLFREERTNVLASARGDVLEIGFGTGLNLPHYPPSIARLTAVDPMQALPTRVANRCRSVSFPVQVVPVTSETLPFDDGRFDCAVSTWTLCTIPDPVTALREIQRVLKPGGLFLFAEHGRSDDARIAAWQDRLNPFQNVIACGCNLNRRIDRLILAAGLTLDRLDRFELPGVPRVAGTMYRGRARA
jgi:ubiquinone/menaquinone biosynthesis C-methylase UbiE